MVNRLVARGYEGLYEILTLVESPSGCARG